MAHQNHYQALSINSRVLHSNFTRNFRHSDSSGIDSGNPGSYILQCGGRLVFPGLDLLLLYKSDDRRIGRLRGHH